MQTYHIFHSWLDTHIARQKSADDLMRRRKMLWSKLQPAIAKTPALMHLSGQSLDKFPILSPMQIRDDIGRWNSCSISHEAAHMAAQDAEKGGNGEIRKNIIAGYSTGTSGTRGVFLTSQKERALHLGQSIARLFPLSTLPKARIMLFLRANSRLYNDSKLFSLKYCPLTLSLREKLLAIAQYRPTILIAPPHILAELANASVNIEHLSHCFYGAEPMGDTECDWITKKLGIRPSPIYQATEGFLGSACRYGHLHLNEDSIEVEFSAVNGTSGFQITVTDLLRKTQPVIRVQLDDYIELDNHPCVCGFTGKIIRPVAGRVRDIWRYPDKFITPREITALLEDALLPSTAWKAVGSPHAIQLHVPLATANANVQDAVKKLKDLVPLKCQVHVSELTVSTAPKRHRIEWRDK